MSVTSRATPSVQTADATLNKPAETAEKNLNQITVNPTVAQLVAENFGILV